jgi:hypothetical protein
MKPALFLLAALSLSPFAHSQQLILRLQHGTEQPFEAHRLQKIRFANNSLILDLKDGSSLPFSLDEVSQLGFSGTTAVENTTDSRDIYFNGTDRNLYFKGLSGETNFLSLYRSDGRLVIQKSVTQQGSLNLSTLAPGIYFVHIGSHTLTFSKPL